LLQGFEMRCFRWVAAVALAGSVAAAEVETMAIACGACHGQDGVSGIAPDYPSIGGQNERYLLTQLRLLKSGERPATGVSALLIRDWRGLVVLDEAYVEFSEVPSLVPQVDEFPNLVVMRTLSKAFGRAALRLGYAVASPLVTSFFLKVKAPYNLSSLVMQKGLEALEGWQRHRATWLRIRRERDRLSRELASFPGLGRVYPSRSNFLLFDCPNAGSVCSKLRETGIVVRDRSDLPGLSECIRVSVGTPEENDLFLRELRRVLT